MTSFPTYIKTDFDNIKKQQYKEQETLQHDKANSLGDMTTGFNNVKGLSDLNGFNFLLYGTDVGCATKSSNWGDDISGNTDMNKKKRPKSIIADYATYKTDTAGLYRKLVVFLLIYFILYFIIALFFSIETLFFIFNGIDFIVIVGLIFYTLFGLTIDTLYFIKYIWFSIKPFFIDITYLLYLVILILGLKFGLFLFHNKFDISKPLVLSLIEGFTYVLLIIAVIIDVLQLAFGIPLVNILEKDIDVQYNAIYGYADDDPAKGDSNTCVNINTIKDPEAIRSFYDLQMSNYKKMTDYYNKTKPPSSSSHHHEKYKPDITSSDGRPENTKKTKYMPKSMFDKNIELTMKYWIDNSSNIMRDVKKAPNAPK